MIEIRPNLPTLVSNSTQCDVSQEGCCKKNICSEHMKLWNELYEVIHDTSTFKFSDKNWFKKQNEVKDSLIDIENGMNCSEIWPKISTQALDNIMHLKKEIQKEKEKDERERYALALTKFNDLEEQLELEKNMRNQDCQTLEAIILELRNQVTSQAEEIRRLWTENLTIENDEMNTKSIEYKYAEDALETKQRILELENQLANELKQQKIISRDQEIQCEFFHLDGEELEKSQIVTLVENIEYDNLKLKIEEFEKEKVQAFAISIFD